jgi:hypothetical protein
LGERFCLRGVLAEAGSRGFSTCQQVKNHGLEQTGQFPSPFENQICTLENEIAKREKQN